jgi:glutamyl-tRNA synthetase
MNWLGLDWDEGPEVGGEFGPYFQSERLAIYDRWFEVLREKGCVYEDDGAWRFRFQRQPLTFTDLVCGEITIDYSDESNTPDMVIKRSDGTYVFHFVNVVDDLEMQISHVIRGEDHLMNTPKHLQLFNALGAEPPAYAHIPLILNSNGSKMSKRDEGAAVGEYPKLGYLPEAVVNFLALLGWSPKSDEEIFAPEELIERFSLEAVNRSPARFDAEKCAWLNQQHLAQLDDASFAALAEPYVEAAGLACGGDRYPAAARAIREKVRLLGEVPGALGFLLCDEFPLEPEALEKVRSNSQAASLLDALAGAFAAAQSWSGDEAKGLLGEVAQAHGAKPGQLMFPVRVALSGRAGGPDLGAILEILGAAESARRLRGLVTHLA